MSCSIYRRLTGGCWLLAPQVRHRRRSSVSHAFGTGPRNYMRTQQSSSGILRISHDSLEWWAATGCVLITCIGAKYRGVEARESRWGARCFHEWNVLGEPLAGNPALPGIGRGDSTKARDIDTLLSRKCHGCLQAVRYTLHIVFVFVAGSFCVDTTGLPARSYKKHLSSEAHFILCPPPLNTGFNKWSSVAPADERNFLRHIS